MMVVGMGHYSIVLPSFQEREANEEGEGEGGQEDWRWRGRERRKIGRDNEGQQPRRGEMEQKERVEVRRWDA
jgi:hypothetical protein